MTKHFFIRIIALTSFFLPVELETLIAWRELTAG
jgi:hypothetical protein